MKWNVQVIVEAIGFSEVQFDEKQNIRGNIMSSLQVREPLWKIHCPTHALPTPSYNPHPPVLITPVAYTTLSQ